jgi:phenylacetate-CoA ligase
VYIAAMLATPELIREAGQLPRLAELLRRWRAVPLYRDVLQGARLNFSHPEPVGEFQRLPLLAKRGLREGFPHRFLTEGQALDDLLANNLVELEHTSGTSEERLSVIFGRDWWDAQEERALRLNAYVARVLDDHPGARRVTLTPPACNGLACPTVWMSRHHRTRGNTLFLNLARIPFLLSDTELARMAKEAAEWSPQFLDVDPVHGARFALYCERQGIRFPSLRFVLCSYEFVSVVHRRILERAFGVPVFNLYGSTETGHLLMENEHGEMKPGYDAALLELVSVDNANIGELVVTTFTNHYLPLLRYRIDDLAEKVVRPYGNHFVVHGRSRDSLAGEAGQRLTTWQVDQCFAGVNGVLHYELRQDKSGDCVLRFVPEDTGPTDADLHRVTSRLAPLLEPDVQVTTAAMPVLLPQPSGKFRLTHPVAGSESEPKGA